MGETQKMPMQFELGAKIKLMGVDLSSFYKKSNDVHQILVMPSNLDNNAVISIDEMIKDFNSFFGEELTPEDIKDKINAIQDTSKTEGTNDKTINYEDIRFCLKMLYLNIKKSSSGKTIEYALSIQIIMDGLIPNDIKLFNVDSLSLNIWNTQNKDIIDRMSLIDPSIID